jgi:glycosyltransferase A (GT-A) superfamily protein (DUF2064 family)
MITAHTLCRGQRIAINGEAYICPASDGGYVLLSLPCHTPRGVFENVVWSQPNTCVSQVLSLRQAGLVVRIGPTYFDIDTPEDILRLRSKRSDLSSSGQCMNTLHCLDGISILE